jgi:predicted DNA-binding transcriptional regulator AlpA
MSIYYRFDDLAKAGIVNNRVTLSRWIKKEGFPVGVMLGPNTRAWPKDEIDRWCSSRVTGRKRSA